MRTVKCVVCGTTFSTSHNVARCCSRECSKKWVVIRSNMKYHERMKTMTEAEKAEWNRKNTERRRRRMTDPEVRKRTNETSRRRLERMSPEEKDEFRRKRREQRRRRIAKWSPERWEEERVKDRRRSKKSRLNESEEHRRERLGKRSAFVKQGVKDYHEGKITKASLYYATLLEGNDWWTKNNPEYNRAHARKMQQKMAEEKLVSAWVSLGIVS